MSERLEARLADLEAEVARLKRTVETGQLVKPWWEQIVGAFAENSAYDEAMQLGQAYRDSLRTESSAAIDAVDVHS